MHDKMLFRIRLSQYGFVKGRHVLDNVFLAYETMEWVKLGYFLQRFVNLCDV